MRLIYYVILPLCCVNIGLAGIFGTWQSISLKGVVKCNGKTASNVTVRLVQTNDGNEVPLAAGITAKNGGFKFDSEFKSREALSAQLHFIHRCDNVKDLSSKPLCPNDSILLVPEEFISEDSEADQMFDMKTIELSSKKFNKTDRNCNEIT